MIDDKLEPFLIVFPFLARIEIIHIKPIFASRYI